LISPSRLLLFQSVVSAFYGAFLTVLFDDLETLALTVRTLACIGSLRRRIEKSLYEDVGFACSMDGCGEASRVGDSLACFR